MGSQNSDFFGSWIIAVASQFSWFEIIGHSIIIPYILICLHAGLYSLPSTVDRRRWIESQRCEVDLSGQPRIYVAGHLPGT